MDDIFAFSKLIWKSVKDSVETLAVEEQRIYLWIEDNTLISLYVHILLQRVMKGVVSE